MVEGYEWNAIFMPRNQKMIQLWVAVLDYGLWIVGAANDGWLPEDIFVTCLRLSERNALSTSLYVRVYVPLKYFWLVCIFIGYV